MKVKVRNYQNKANLLIQALQSQGALIVNDYANILLIDFDGPVNPYPELIQRALEQCSEIVLYSHGAPVITAWDGIWKPNTIVKKYLAQSEGQKWVMEAYGYPKPIQVIGWHYCEQREFIPNNSVKNVLFAPEHPHSNGYMLAEARELTEKVSNNLDNMHSMSIIRNDGPKTIDESVQAIDKADVVVTYPGTFACLAIARGKPVVMYGQNIRPHDGYNDEMLKYVKQWDLYRDYMRYPYELIDTDPRWGKHIICHAAMYEATDWRARFIGEQMKPETLINSLN